MCFHAPTQAQQDWGDSRTCSQCDQTHKHADKSTCLNRHRGHSVRTKGKCKQSEAELQSRAASAVLLPHTGGLQLGREQTGTPWICSGWVSRMRGRAGRPGGRGALPPPPRQQSLVVHQRLDFVHQLTRNLQDVLDIMTLGHLCGSDTWGGKRVKKCTTTAKAWNWRFLRIHHRDSSPNPVPVQV